MDIIFNTLVDTDWGIIIFGSFLLIAIIIEIISNKPKI